MDILPMAVPQLRMLVKDFPGDCVLPRGTGSVPGRGTKILHVAWCNQKKGKKECLLSFHLLSLN